MSSKNPNPEVEAAAAELRAGMEGLSDRQRAEATSALGSIGDKWWVLLVLGVISLVAGLLVVFNPNAAILTIAIFFGIWLLVSGIFTLIRGFGDTMETGARVLSIIVGALSIVLGIMCFRNIANAVELLALFVGIGLVMRGLLEFIVGLSAKGTDGRGSLIFLGVVTFALGVAALVWPNLALGTLVYLIGFALIVMAILEIISAFRVKAFGDRIDEVISVI